MEKQAIAVVMNLKISICIPTYNKFQTIEFTIKSVINQSFNDWELIIIDDSDNALTEKIVNKYSENDNRISYIKNNQRLGLVKNWNECIKQANFEYVYILHHDDFLMPGVLESYSKFALNNPDCGLIHSNCYYVSLPYYTKSIGITQNIPILKKGDEAIDKILFNNNIACSTVMVKKECYDKLGGFDENAWVSPDWEMWARIGKYYDIGHINSIGCAVVLDNQNTHLAAMNLDEFYLQQKYYGKKIVSYFSQNYITNHSEVYNKVDENLVKTIRGLGFHYLSVFKIKTADSYFKKIGDSKNLNYYKILMKSIIKFFYKRVSFQKKTYKEVFNYIYK